MNSTNSGTNDIHLSKSAGVWILLASLLINCFLLGLVLAPAFHRHGPPPFMRPPGDMAEHLTHGLSPADAAIVREAFQKEQTVFSESRLNTDKAMREMIDVLQQPSVEPQALQKTLADISAAHAKLDDAMNSLITKAATDLSPEGRHQFATSILPPPGMPMPPPDMLMHKPPFGDDQHDRRGMPGDKDMLPPPQE